MNNDEEWSASQSRSHEKCDGENQTQARLPEEIPRSRGPIRVLRLAEVMNTVGLSRAMIYKLQGEGRFPRPVKITGSRAVRWVEQDIQAWLAQQIERNKFPPTE